MTEKVKVKDKERKLGKAVDMTFPGSDPMATGKTTGTEPAKRPADRKAPIISKEEIERARRGRNQSRRHIDETRRPARKLIAPPR